MQPFQKLWAKSGQTMRPRFKQLLSEMGLADVTLNGKPLDPGSLRPGGAMWILQLNLPTGAAAGSIKK